MAIIESGPSQLQRFEQQDSIGEYEIFVCHDPQGDIWLKAQEVEAEVFITSGYVKTEAELQQDYQAYLGDSEMLAVLDADDVVGSVRAIRFSEGLGFKTINDAATGRLTIDDFGKEFLFGNVDPEKTMEIGTIAIPKDKRGLSEKGLHISTLLYGAIYEAAHRNGAEWLLASFDEQYLVELFLPIFGESVTILGPAKDYMGSKTTPVAIHVERAINQVAEVGLQDTFDSILQVGQQLKHER